MRITIAIPTFNRADSLRETLSSLGSLEIPEGVSCEVLVVDNASSDHTQTVIAAAIDSFPIPLRVVVEPRPGLCHGRNRALAEAVGEHVVYVDDDIRISSRWLFGYKRAVENVQADCVVGPVFPVFPSPLPSYATRFVLSLIGSDYSRRGDQPLVLSFEAAHEIPGCNFGVRKEKALALGGMSTALGRVGGGLLAGEDTEFGIRLRNAGGRVAYEPDCWIEHLITPGKLDQAYLRRRVNGLGLTSAKLRAMHGPPRRSRDWFKVTKRAIGLWVRWQKRRLSGTPAEIFEWELRTRRVTSELVASLVSERSSSRSSHLL